ncbi:MAG: radical SAM protein [Desulfovibrionales bacterium]|nr:radical SAM protein [Desulfovibrionales bacterium]
MDGLDIQKPIAPSPEVLLRIGLGLTRACNLSCLYCVTDAGIAGSEMTMHEYADLLQQARALGVRTVALVGEGEPLLFTALTELLDILQNFNMKPILFTNGLMLNVDLAHRLWDAGASVILKMNSLDPRIHDDLVGCVGAHHGAMRALDILLAAGFSDCEPTRLGIQTVIVPSNLKNIEDLWRFCRQGNYYPYFETLRRCGRAASRPSLVVPKTGLAKLFLRLQSIDLEVFGLTWDAHPPHVAHTCQQHFYSCYVRADGSVTPCSGLSIVQGNVCGSSLRHILNQPLFQRLRKMHENIQGACAMCRFGKGCYGCRANAWASSGDVFGNDPDCWVNQ